MFINEYHHTVIKGETFCVHVRDNAFPVRVEILTLDEFRSVALPLIDNITHTGLLKTFYFGDFSNVYDNENDIECEIEISPPDEDLVVTVTINSVQEWLYGKALKLVSSSGMVASEPFTVYKSRIEMTTSMFDWNNQFVNREQETPPYSFYKL